MDESFENTYVENGIEYLKCPLCNQSHIKRLSIHCKHKHKLTLKELKLKFPTYKITSSDTKNNISENCKKNWEKTREQRYITMHSESYHKHNSDGVKKAFAREEIKQKLVQNTKNMWKNPNIRKKICDAISKSWVTREEEKRLNSIKAFKTAYLKSHTVEAQAKRNISMRKYYDDPKYIKKMSENTKKLWNDPKYREYIVNRHIEQLNILMQDESYRVNYLKTHTFIFKQRHYYYNNNDFDSLYEVNFARMLTENNIEFIREPKEYIINYRDEKGLLRRYYPDFYIPKFNLVVEIKSKVYLHSFIDKYIAMKNTNIPFLLITEYNWESNNIYNMCNVRYNYNDKRTIKGIHYETIRTSCA